MIRRPVLRVGIVAAFSALAIVLAAAGPIATPMSAAFLTVSSTSTASLTADTLNPPTDLGATGGSIITLTWTPTSDAYASGYQVHRATSSGGSYSQVGSVTPRTAASATDTPPTAGTYWYVLYADAPGWTSAATSEVSAAFASTGDTDFKPCAAQAADTGGDGNGYQGSAANGCVEDGLVATDTNSGSSTSTSCTNSGKDRHRFSTFALGVPPSATAINGISVRTKLGVDAVSGTILLCAQLSWNAGTSWTSVQSVAVTATALTTYTLGGTTFTWGRTWTGTELSDANFRVRLINVASSTARDFSLDSVEVRVAYTP